MTTNSILRSELNNIVLSISQLATEVSNRLTNGQDIIDVAGELVKKTATFTFDIGQLYAVEKTTATTSSGTTVTVNVGSNVARNYHNVRDSHGRFTRV